MTDKRIDLPGNIHELEDVATEFSSEEREEAVEFQNQILEGTQQMLTHFWDVIEVMYRFAEKEYYRVFKKESMRDWVESRGFTPRTYMRYMSTYESLTVNNKIPLEKYQDADIVKMEQLKRLADAGVEEEELEDFIDLSYEMVTRDFQENVDDGIRRIKAGRPATEDEARMTDEEFQKIQDPWEKLAPKKYILVPLTPETRNMDPAYNGKNLERVTGVRAQWYYNREEDRFSVETK